MDAYCNVNDADSNPISPGKHASALLLYQSGSFLLPATRSLDPKIYFPKLLKINLHMATGHAVEFCPVEAGHAVTGCIH